MVRCMVLCGAMHGAVHLLLDHFQFSPELWRRSEVCQAVKQWFGPGNVALTAVKDMAWAAAMTGYDNLR